MNKKRKSRSKKRVRKKETLSKGVCVECGKNAKGYPIEDDYVINGIRWIKRKLGVEKGNKLIVCNDCFEEYKKKRNSFERSLIIYSGIGVVLGIILLVINLSIGAFISALILILFLLVLAHLKYAPKVRKR